MTRKAFLDRSAGEARGVVTFDGRPERLLIERDGDLPCQRLGAVMTARVARIERALSTAYLQLPEGRDAVLEIKPGAVLAEGASIEIEIAAEARREKGAVARLVGSSSGPPRLISEAPGLTDRLAALVPGAPLAEGDAARQAADEAMEAVLAKRHALPGGGAITIEPTAALIAIDVDLGDRGGSDAARAVRQTNLSAIASAAPLLRLKGLGGLVVFDLAGKGHDGAAMTTAAKAAFGPDGSGVSIGPISRFGLFEIAVPRTGTPLADILLDDAGRPAALTVALDLLRALEREGRANPGARLTATCAPSVAAATGPHQAALAQRLGPRFTIAADAALSRVQFSVTAQ